MECKSQRFYLFPIFDEGMQGVLHLVTALSDHVQVLQVQVLQLLQKIDLLVQVYDGRLLALNVSLDHGNAALAFLELTLNRRGLFCDLLCNSAKRVSVAPILNGRFLCFSYRLSQLFFNSFLIIKGVLQLLFLLDQVRTLLF
jgi:hypothetical protein